jgi:formylglycine-generating enzyme required for sulfatase activity
MIKIFFYGILYLIMMIKVQGGTFDMGSLTGMADERPVHSVTLSDFLIEDHTVTQKEWTELMGSNPSYFTIDSGGEHASQRPVERVSQYDGFIYCNKRSIKEGLTPCYLIYDSVNPENWGEAPENPDRFWNNTVCHWGANGYRLPTEAEWEFAARGGLKEKDYLTKKYCDTSNTWNKTNSGMTAHEVCLKKPNALGIYDMCGNVWEMCWDWNSCYTAAAATNPHGRSSGTLEDSRIGRGGSWNSYDTDCSPFFRNGGLPTFRYSFIGIRVVRNK